MCHVQCNALLSNQTAETATPRLPPPPLPIRPPPQSYMMKSDRFKAKLRLLPAPMTTLRPVSFDSHGSKFHTD